MNRVYLISGGNMGNRTAMMEEAEKLLNVRCGMITNYSSIYETEAWGMENALPFLNRVIQIDTENTAEEVLHCCLKIENELGRTRNNTGKYESRTCDLDILFFNNEIISNQNLTIPHPKIEFRRFVLEPLCEIAPDFIHPVLKKSVREILQECEDKSEVRKTNYFTGTLK